MKLDTPHRYDYGKTRGVSMNTVTVSSKFQVVIPKETREDIGLEVGTIMEVISYGTRIELIPIQPIRNLKGLFKGLNTDIDREDDRL
jgi:AbrB family looped-hinge helix DNA binding protein